jgi:hypothetical protein
VAGLSTRSRLSCRHIMGMSLTQPTQPMHTASTRRVASPRRHAYKVPMVWIALFMLMSTLRPKADVIKWQRHRKTARTTRRRQGRGYRTTTRYMRVTTSARNLSRSGPHLKIDKFIYLAYHQPPPITNLLLLDDVSGLYTTITMAQSEFNESLKYLLEDVASFGPYLSDALTLPRPS